MSKKISIIVPVYNVEKFLHRCLESIMKQTYTDFELILVDDGSTDSSGIICDEFAHNYDNTIVLHQQNCGLSAARNMGVSVSSGEYITFIDSDDYVSNDYLYVLWDILVKNGVEVVCAPLVSFCGDSYIGSQNVSIEGILTSEEALEVMCYKTLFGVSACAKLFKRSIVVECPFPEGRIYEDLATTYKMISCTDGIAYTSKDIYYRYERLGSISRSIGENAFDGIYAVNEMIDFFSAKYPAIVCAAQYRGALKFIEYMPYLLEKNEYNSKFFYAARKELRSCLLATVKNRKSHLNQRIEAFVILCGYRIARPFFLAISYIKKIIH